eukprot:CAMPEP_0118936016 /NCGR_PEP_ID=MMETSP1169-20130426/15959_1 /TAXON_ID=36882 /ORGANISM="Pyramimonas obovata, Strain CCMP722" /LENGTH=201 /DNA_ID=CAMNT_0006879107 /DNA_START=141 /DNA_END=743 /DNA_ORIENTATION=-
MPFPNLSSPFKRGGKPTPESKQAPPSEPPALSAAEEMLQSIEKALQETKAVTAEVLEREEQANVRITEAWRTIKFLLVLLLLVLPLGPANYFAAGVMAALALYDEVRQQRWTFERVLQYQVLLVCVWVALHLGLYLSIGAVQHLEVTMPAYLLKYSSHIPIDFTLATVQTQLYMKMAKEASSLGDAYVLASASFCFTVIVW